MTQTKIGANLFACGHSEINDSAHPRIDVGKDDDANDDTESDQYAVDYVVVGRRRLRPRAERTETVHGHQDERDDETD